jgi:hypothetical protein
MIKEVCFATVIVGFALVAVLGSVASAGEPIDPKCEKVLPAAAVGKLAGAKVQLVGRDPSIGAGGDCNYATGDKGTTMVLMTHLHNPGSTKDVDTYRGVTKGMKQEAIAKLGDEAFSAGDTIVVARAGTIVVALSGYAKADPKAKGGLGQWLTKAQLIELTRQMLAAAK